MGRDGGGVGRAGRCCCAPDRCVAPGDMGTVWVRLSRTPSPLTLPSSTVWGTWGENAGPEALQRELPRAQKLSKAL